MAKDPLVNNAALNILISGEIVELAMAPNVQETTSFICILWELSAPCRVTGATSI